MAQKIVSVVQPGRKANIQIRVTKFPYEAGACHAYQGSPKKVSGWIYARHSFLLIFCDRQTINLSRFFIKALSYAGCG